MLNVLFAAIFSLLLRVAVGSNFSVNQNYLLFENNLANIFGKFGDMPDFDSIDWCLIDSNAGFVFLNCEGLQYSLMFDATSYLDSLPTIEGLDQEYKLLDVITSDQVVPQMVSKLSTIGDSLAVITRNTTVSGQAASILTFYRVNGGNEVAYRKNGVLATNEILSAWGSSDYQLYHIRGEGSDIEEILVTSEKGKVVTQLNFDDFPDRPSSTKLSYDVFQERNGNKVETTSIYVVAQFHDLSVDVKTQRLFKHTIDPTGRQKSYIDDEINLAINCTIDTIKVHNKFITLACGQNETINFLDRLSLQQVNQNVTLIQHEFFHSVNMAQQNKYSGEAIGFQREYLKVISQEIQEYVLFTTYETIENVYKLNVAEIIEHDFVQLVNAQKMNVNVTYASPQPIEILRSEDPIQIIQMQEKSVSLFFQGSAELSYTFPVCFLDQYLKVDGVTCGQCPLGSYGLSPQASECTSCSYLFGTLLDADQTEKLTFLCQNQIGQISSDNKGVFAVEDYPTELTLQHEWTKIALKLGIQAEDDNSGGGFIIDEENIVIKPSQPDNDNDNDNEVVVDETEGNDSTDNSQDPIDPDMPDPSPATPPNSKDGKVTREDKKKAEKEEEQGITGWIPILIAVLGVIFLIPWVVIAVVQIKKRLRRIQIQKNKDFQQQQMLKITDYGREIRRSARAPNGESYSNPDEREQKFRKIDKFAPEHEYVDCKALKKFQTTCAICVEDFVDKDMVRITGCSHLFHSQCLMMWAKSKIWANTRRIGSPCCPNCNANLLDVPVIPQESDDGRGVELMQGAGMNGGQGDHQDEYQSNRYNSRSGGSFQVGTFLINEPIRRGQVVPMSNYDLSQSPIPNQVMISDENFVRNTNGARQESEGDFERAQPYSARYYQENIQSNTIEHDGRASQDYQENGRIGRIGDASPSLATKTIGSTMQASGWQTLTAGKPPIKHKQQGKNMSHQFSTMKPKSGRLEVISEDENIFQSNFARNLDVKNSGQHMGAANGNNLHDQHSDASSTNAYFVRKQKILDAITKQQMGNMSDGGYQSITEQPMYVNIDGVSRENTPLGHNITPLGQHPNGGLAKQKIYPSYQNHLSNLNYVSSDDQSLGVSNSAMRLRQKIPTNYGTQANMSNIEGGYISSPQIVQPQLVSLHSDGESVEGKGTHQGHEFHSVHQSVSGTAKEIFKKQPNSLRSLTLQSQGARTLGLHLKPMIAGNENSRAHAIADDNGSVGRSSTQSHAKNHRNVYLSSAIVQSEQNTMFGADVSNNLGLQSVATISVVNQGNIEQDRSPVMSPGLQNLNSAEPAIMSNNGDVVSARDMRNISQPNIDQAQDYRYMTETEAVGGGNIENERALMQNKRSTTQRQVNNAQSFNY